MKRKTFLLILLALVLMAALSVTAFADGASTHIQGHNLKVTDHVELIYYVAFDESPTAYDAAGVLIYTSEKDAYTLANADTVIDSYGSTQTTARATYYKYYYAGLADYQMGDVLYARPYYVDGTEVVYGSVDSYSVLQYAMEQTGKTGCEPRTALVPILEQLLEEGAAAQIAENYKVDQLVTGEYGYISLEGAVLPDGVSANGGFLVGQDVTLTGLGGTIAWYDEAGEQIATGKTLDVTVTAEPQFFRAVCTEHDFEAILVSPATCTESALYLDTCECGAVDGDPYTVGDPLGHTAVTDPAVAATCTETGLTAGSHCSVCNAVLVAQEVVPALGHVEVTDAAVAPTCTETGLTAGKHCSRCDAVLVAQETVAALGHDLVNHAAQAATCSEIGWAAYNTCSRCDYTTYEEIAALGHDYNAVVTAPTCTEAGYTTHTCSRCSDSYVDTYTDALGHSWNSGVVTTAPTCTAKGVKTYTCTVCSATRTEDVAATGHTSVTDPAVAATCTATGKTAGSHCSVCGTVLTAQQTVAALGHNSVTDPAVAATCTATGKTEGSHCSRCGTVLTAQQTVAALGHSWNSGSVTTQPTCTAKGVKTYTCTRCSGTRTEDVAALGHNINHETGVCTRCSYTQVVYTSNGDGTCKVTGVNATSDTLITINTTSPAGDTVTSIAANAFNGSAVKELVIPASVTSIAANAFNGATYTLTKVYYGSNEIAWSRVSIGSGNGKLTGATIYYYDANEPLGGNAWHFVSSTPTVWTISDEWGELIPLN